MITLTQYIKRKQTTLFKIQFSFHHPVPAGFCSSPAEPRPIGSPIDSAENTQAVNVALIVVWGYVPKERRRSPSYTKFCAVPYYAFFV